MEDLRESNREHFLSAASKIWKCPEELDYGDECLLKIRTALEQATSV